jgi:hypothetical protein
MNVETLRHKLLFSQEFVRYKVEGRAAFVPTILSGQLDSLGILKSGRILHIKKSEAERNDQILVYDFDKHNSSFSVSFNTFVPPGYKYTYVFRHFLLTEEIGREIKFKDMRSGGPLKQVRFFESDTFLANCGQIKLLEFGEDDKCMICCPTGNNAVYEIQLPSRDQPEMKFVNRSRLFVMNCGLISLAPGGDVVEKAPHAISIYRRKNSYEKATILISIVGQYLAQYLTKYDWIIWYRRFGFDGFYAVKGTEQSYSSQKDPLIPAEKRKTDYSKVDLYHNIKEKTSDTFFRVASNGLIIYILNQPRVRVKGKTEMWKLAEVYKIDEGLL